MARCPRVRSAAISPAYSAIRASPSNTSASALAKGKTVFEYRYRVPLDASHFEIKVASPGIPPRMRAIFKSIPNLSTWSA